MSVMLKQIADKLEQDIRGRGLLPGSRYQTGEEIARNLGTSVATANRALKLLAEQEIVVRNPRSGTFVGPALAQGKTSEIRMVTILCPISERKLHTVKFDPLMEGLLSNMPDVTDVRIGYVPSEGDVDYVRQLLEPSAIDGRVAGVVAISCSHSVYRFLGESRYPFVVMGSLYLGQSFPSICMDERQGGYLLTHHLLERGHRRLALLSNSESCPGDHYFHDGVSDALTEAELPHNALILRILGPETELVKGQVEELLRLQDPPTGFIVKVPQWIPGVMSVIKAHGKEASRSVDVVYRADICGGAGDANYVHIRPQSSNRVVAQLLGQMLAKSRQFEPMDSNSVVVPYELCS
jgi:GntR family transcriptional regulator of arabinose operon